MKSLWTKEKEKEFFIESLKNYATPEQLFYFTDDERYIAYWPKNYKGKKSTIQSRNSLIGKFTEKKVVDLFNKIVNKRGLHAVQGVICNDLGLTANSPADVVISKKRDIRQLPDDILMIIEVKMSLLWNWELTKSGKLSCLGDYSTHQGNPSLLRSDSMLKAIGKSLNIRISSFDAAVIPIIVVGNSPIAESYFQKVDLLKSTGVVQGFWSINPTPLDKTNNTLKNTKRNGFYKFDSYLELENAINDLLQVKKTFFASMKSHKELGQIIEKANTAETYEEKGKLFIKLLEE